MIAENKNTIQFVMGSKSLKPWFYGFMVICVVWWGVVSSGVRWWCLSGAAGGCVVNDNWI